MTFMLISIFAAAATAAPAPSIFVLHPEGEKLVLEAPTPPNDGTTGDEPVPMKAPAVTKGMAFRKVDLSGIGESVPAAGDGKIAADGCGEAERPLVPFEAVPASETPYVLVPGNWAATVPIVTESAATPAYEAIIAPIVAAAGIKNAKIVRGQAVKADLDGDGVQELILSATNAVEGDQKTGDYSVLLVQRMRGGKSDTVQLLVQTLNEDNRELEGGVVTPEIVAVADVDGDGRMEIVTLNIGYEELWAEAWSIVTNGKAKVTFKTYCGA